jgi:ubiquinone/menaquinone biosynthesis C-methylase UbiE
MEGALGLTREELERGRAHFWKRTEQYRSLGFDRLAAAAFVAECAGEIGGPALDVGTGKGLFAMALASKGLDVVSVDVEPEEQALAAFLAKEAGLADRITFLLEDASALPFPDGRFATCAMMDVLHHLGGGAGVLAEMERVLMPGGSMIVSDFTREGLELIGRVHASEGRDHPVGPVTPLWAEGYLEGLGLKAAGTWEGALHRVALLRKPREAGPSLAPAAFSRMSRTGLLKSLEAFAKNWLAHDGCWFLAAEEKLGMGVAMELDAGAWGRFAAAEAKRILADFGVVKGGGLEALEKALERRMYAFLNPQHSEWSSGRDRLRFTMETCRVQEARRRKGLPDFPCKPVGEVEFSTFAKTVDPRIRVRCLHCPPDPSEERGCAWEFWLEEEA